MSPHLSWWTVNPGTCGSSRPLGGGGVAAECGVPLGLCLPGTPLVFQGLSGPFCVTHLVSFFPSSEDPASFTSL